MERRESRTDRLREAEMMRVRHAYLSAFIQLYAPEGSPRWTEDDESLLPKLLDEVHKQLASCKYPGGAEWLLDQVVELYFADQTDELWERKHPFNLLVRRAANYIDVLLCKCTRRWAVEDVIRVAREKNCHLTKETE